MLSGSAGDQGSSSSKKLQAVSSMCSGITVSKYLKYSYGFRLLDFTVSAIL
jgi:hypothetical protein